MTDWCILRCASSQTLNLAASLSEAGFEVWTPREIREKRMGKKREIIEQEMPILPEWVFASMEDLTDLLNLSHSSGLPYRVWDKRLRRIVLRDHPRFQVFRMHGTVRPQADNVLAPLRELEAALSAALLRRRERARCKGPAPRFEAGQIVRVDGGFEGLNLKVAEANQGKVVKLTHPDWMWTVEISAWRLSDIQLSQAPPEHSVLRTAA